MNRNTVVSIFALLCATTAWSAPSATPTPSPTAAADSNQEIERRIDLLADDLQRLKLGSAGVSADATAYGLGPAASKVYRANPGVSLGGYGEMIYDRFAKNRSDGSALGLVDRLNLTRVVFYFGYKWDERWIFNSEVEYENASTEGSGEVSVEFAYLDRLISKEFNFRIGNLLIPIGWINELHEPVVFLGASRPVTELTLIPTTWDENGLGIFGTVGSFNYKAYLVAGLNASAFNATGLDEAKQGGSNTNADAWALATRWDYTSIPNVSLGISAYVGGSSRNPDTERQDSGTDSIFTQIYDIHAQYRNAGLWLRALLVANFIKDAGELNAQRLANPDLFVASQMRGGYLEAGYDLKQGLGPYRLMPFARFEVVQTQAKMPTGYAALTDTDQKILTAGIQYLPMDQVVFKGNFTRTFLPESRSYNQIQLSMGYIF